MKEVILSADGDCMIYRVPDQVAEHLSEYCIEFCDHWLKTSPDAAQYRQHGVLCYTEADFIAYLNRWVFPDEPSVPVRNLGCIGYGNPIPGEYADYPRFNF